MCYIRSVTWWWQKCPWHCNSVPAELAPCSTLRSSFPLASTLTAPWQSLFCCGLWHCLFSESWGIPSKEKKGKKLLSSPHLFHATALLHLFFLLLPYFSMMYSNTSYFGSSWAAQQECHQRGLPAHLSAPDSSCELGRHCCGSNMSSLAGLPGVGSCSSAGTQTTFPLPFALTGSAPARLSSASVRRFIFSGPV